MGAARNLRRGVAAVACIGVPIALSACFLGYDSRWGQAKAAQKRLAASSAPAEIASTTEDAPPSDAGKKTWRVRVRPDGQYLAQNMEAPKRVADLLEDANRVLVPSLGLELDLDRVQPWTTDADDRPDVAMSTLLHDDPGQDVDLVVGMIGALPRQSASLHEEGRATLLGKHVLVRGPSRVGEHDAVDLSFGELSEDQRAAMLRLRQRHRALATLLHEVGHCLGAIHETEPASLMAPTYDPKMGGFGGGAIALMRAALASGDMRAVAASQLELLEGAAGAGWVEADRDAEVARLRTFVGARTSAAASAASASPTSDGPTELTADARSQFVRAHALLRAGAVRNAYETAKPLFAAYPNVYAVQDLRCQLATVRWLPREQMLAECAPVGRMAGDAGADAARP